MGELELVEVSGIITEGYCHFFCNGFFQDHLYLSCRISDRVERGVFYRQLHIWTFVGRILDGSSAFITTLAA